MKIESFTTSFGSHISPYIQKQVIKRIGLNEDFDTIINEEVKDILDRHPNQYDEAHEIVTHCENVLVEMNKTKTNA
jgi:hypothetical protein